MAIDSLLAAWEHNLNFHDCVKFPFIGTFTQFVEVDRNAFGLQKNINKLLDGTSLEKLDIILTKCDQIYNGHSCALIDGNNREAMKMFKTFYEKEFLVLDNKNERVDKIEFYFSKNDEYIGKIKIEISSFDSIYKIEYKYYEAKH